MTYSHTLKGGVSKETNLVRQAYKLKIVKPRVFKFEKGQSWDGDEEIIRYILKLLIGEDDVGGTIAKIQQKTYITIQCAKAVKTKKGGLNSSQL